MSKQSATWVSSVRRSKATAQSRGGQTNQQSPQTLGGTPFLPMPNLYSSKIGSNFATFSPVNSKNFTALIHGVKPILSTRPETPYVATVPQFSPKTVLAAAPSSSKDSTEPFKLETDIQLDPSVVDSRAAPLNEISEPDPILP